MVYVLSLSKGKRNPLKLRRTGEGDCGEFCLYSQRIDSLDSKLFTAHQGEAGCMDLRGASAPMEGRRVPTVLNQRFSRGALTWGAENSQGAQRAWGRMRRINT